MNILSAHLEPYMQDNTVGVAAVLNGLIEHIPSTKWWDPNTYTKGEQEALERMGLDYRWPLPRRLGVPPHDTLPTLGEIHRRIILCLRKYVWFSDENLYDVIGNWIIGTYFRDQFKTQPILIFDGITVSGKSTVMKVLRELVYRGELMSSGSGAAMAREITDYDTTLLLDEVLDSLNSDRGQDIYNMMKSCFDRNGMWIRADPKGRGNYKYSTYTSLAVSVKGDSLPDDVYNRGLRINMTSMPAGTELGDIECADEDDDCGPDSPIEIRTDLYALKCYTIAHPDEKPAIRFHEYQLQTKQHFTQKVGDKWMYAFVHDMPDDSPQIRDRKRKIASTLYTIGLATATGEEVIQTIIKQGAWEQEITADTPEAIAFVALLELIEDEWKVMAPLYRHMDRGAFCAVVSAINTTQIAERYNLILYDQGNAMRDRVLTKQVTAKLGALGLAYKRGAANKSMMDPTDGRFIPNFLRYLSKYAPRSVARYRRLTEKEDQNS